ncbi:hypothetical protein AVEN_254680-1 [Araneus ventricosus]|uniref:Uncharacterized protein n=1 Tax=Araneus ventricosus TaxID=182803 RepID=A0A4Y2R578_ARAVE|nr:hypothetical protein AVEN_254680-1 [Araneus ventricosus]
MKKIGEIVHKSKSTIQYIERYRELVTFDPRYRSKRHPMLNSMHKRNVLRKVQDNPRISASEVAADLKTYYNIEITLQNGGTAALMDEPPLPPPWCPIQVERLLRYFKHGGRSINGHHRPRPGSSRNRYVSSSVQANSIPTIFIRSGEARARLVIR